MKILVHDQEDYDHLVKASRDIHDRGFVDFNTTNEELAEENLKQNNPAYQFLIHLYTDSLDDNHEAEKAALAKIIIIDPTVPKLFKIEDGECDTHFVSDDDPIFKDITDE